MRITTIPEPWQHYGAYKKVREAMRDMLYVKYGEAWRGHEGFPPNTFFDPAHGASLLKFLLRVAEGDKAAWEAIK